MPLMDFKTYNIEIRFFYILAGKTQIGVRHSLYSKNYKYTLGKYIKKQLILVYN